MIYPSPSLQVCEPLSTQGHSALARSGAVVVGEGRSAVLGTAWSPTWDVRETPSAAQPRRSAQSDAVPSAEDTGDPGGVGPPHPPMLRALSQAASWNRRCGRGCGRRAPPWGAQAGESCFQAQLPQSLAWAELGVP